MYKRMRRLIAVLTAAFVVAIGMMTTTASPSLAGYGVGGPTTGTPLPGDLYGAQVCAGEGKVMVFYPATSYSGYSTYWMYPGGGGSGNEWNRSGGWHITWYNNTGTPYPDGSRFNGHFNTWNVGPYLAPGQAGDQSVYVWENPPQNGPNAAEPPGLAYDAAINGPLNYSWACYPQFSWFNGTPPPSVCYTCKNPNGWNVDCDGRTSTLPPPGPVQIQSQTASQFVVFHGVTATATNNPWADPSWQNFPYCVKSKPTEPNPNGDGTWTGFTTVYFYRVYRQADGSPAIDFNKADDQNGTTTHNNGSVGNSFQWAWNNQDLNPPSGLKFNQSAIAKSTSWKVRTGGGDTTSHEYKVVCGPSPAPGCDPAQVAPPQPSGYTISALQYWVAQCESHYTYTYTYPVTTTTTVNGVTTTTTTNVSNQFNFNFKSKIALNGQPGVSAGNYSGDMCGGNGYDVQLFSEKNNSPATPPHAVVQFEPVAQH